MDPIPRGPGLDDLPDIPLLKISGFLDCNSLLALSQTTSTIFHNLSPNEHLWSKKLAEEYINADLSPKFLTDVFPVSCQSKRLLLLRKRINNNLRTGSLSPAGQRCIQGQSWTLTLGDQAILSTSWGLGDQIILNDDYIVIANAKQMTFSIDVFKMQTRQWTTLELSSYFQEDSIYDDSRFWDPDDPAGSEKRAIFRNIAISGSSVALLAERSGNCRRKILFFIDVSGFEPKLIRRVDLRFNDNSYLFGTTKLYQKDADTNMYCTRSLKEIDLKTGDATREVHINDHECFIYDDFLSADNLLCYKVNHRNEADTPRMCDLMTGVSTILTEDPGIFFAYFHPDGTNPRPVLYGKEKYDSWSYWGRTVKRWTVAKSYGSNYFALYSEKPAIDEQVFVYEVVECDTEQQMLKLNATIVMLGHSSAEHQVEKVQDRGSLEIRFFQELIGKEMQGIDLRRDGFHQSVVIIHDVIVRIRSPLEAGSALLDFTDIKTGEVLREMNFPCDKQAEVALHASPSTIVVLIEDEVKIFDLACDIKKEASGFRSPKLPGFVTKAKDRVSKLFHRK